VRTGSLVAIQRVSVIFVSPAGLSTFSPRRVASRNGATWPGRHGRPQEVGIVADRNDPLPGDAVPTATPTVRLASVAGVLLDV